MAPVTADSIVADLVVERPARSRVFQAFRLDFCCGGKHSLTEACERRRVDVAEVLKALRESDATGAEDADIDVSGLSLVELADHIEQTHHAYLKQELPRLERMIHKVAAVHGGNYPWMREVLAVYQPLAAEMDAHMMKEEQVLFPLIRDLASGGAGASPCGRTVAQPIAAMEHEHDDAGAALERMRTLTSDYTPPADACNTFRAALDGLRELEADMHRHVHKENNVLFPAALRLDRERAGAQTV